MIDLLQCQQEFVVSMRDHMLNTYQGQQMQLFSPRHTASRDFITQSCMQTHLRDWYSFTTPRFLTHGTLHP